MLFDECIDERLRFLFPGHDCQTARLQDQQDLSGRKLSIVILCGRTNRLRDLAALVPAAIFALRSIREGKLVKIR